MEHLPITLRITEAIEEHTADSLTAEQQRFVDCAVKATLAAVPIFLDAMMRCIAGLPPPPPSDQYKPGDRPRC